MKLNKLVVLSTTALLSAAILPAAYAQEDGPRFNRPIEGIDVRPQRSGEFGRPGPARHRPGRPGGNPERLIERLDVDGDGYVDVDEFIDARLGRVDGEFDRRDRDGDGLLSEAEARRHRPRPDDELTEREQVIQCVRRIITDWDGPHDVEDRFDAVDLDGDGYIDLTELSTALETRAFDLFERIDANGDGLISLEEVAAHQEDEINLRRVIRACKDKVTDPFEASI